jgi:hypothetical protein
MLDYDAERAQNEEGTDRKPKNIQWTEVGRLSTKIKVIYKMVTLTLD